MKIIQILILSMLKYQKEKYGQGNSQSDKESKVTDETNEDDKKSVG